MSILFSTSTIAADAFPSFKKLDGKLFCCLRAVCFESKIFSCLFTGFTAGDDWENVGAVTNAKVFFNHIFYVDPQKKQTKTQAFLEILKQTQFQASHILSVGNRLDKEIAESKRLGFATCYVKHGEYIHLQASLPEEYPDHQILNIRELVGTCHL